MKALDFLSEYYCIEVENGNIILNKKKELPQNQSEIKKAMDIVRRHKKSSVDMLLNPIKTYKKVVAVDIETDDLNPHKGEIRLISVVGDDIEIVTEQVDEVAEILADETVLKIFHNGAFDVAWLNTKGYAVKAYTDTMIMGQVIHNHVKTDHSLQGMAKEFLGLQLDKKLQGSENWQVEITEAHKQYCLDDAKTTYKLYHVLDKEIERLNLESTLRREIGALEAVVELNCNGIIFDYRGWEKELQLMKDESEMILESVRAILKQEDLNLQSPVQIIAALRNEGINIEGTSDEVLAKYENKYEVIGLIRKYKKLRKQITSYGERLKELIDDDGRLRGNWRVIGTDTFRMTCKKPNLQGMPGISKKYFCSSEHHSLIVADYSNIELRILAEITRDEELVRAFVNGEDLHTKTAKVVLGRKKSELVSSSERKIGKVINFGLVYGMTKYGLQKKINANSEHNITEEEAAAFRNRYFELYSSVLHYQDSMLKSDFIETLGGRYWSKETKELSRGSIARFNYPIQASGAEGVKDALNLLMKSKKKSWKLVAAVHDEIVLEVPDEDIEMAIIFLKEVMVEGMKKILKTVPVVVEIKSAKYWVKD